MTKKNLIITIILLAIIDLVAAGWYMSRRIETGNRTESLFADRDSTDDGVAEADTLTNAMQDDVFDEVQHNTYYFTSNTPATAGNPSTCYTSIKHVKVRWPKKVNGQDELTGLNKELIRQAFGNNQGTLKDARYVYLNTPEFNKPVGDDYRTLVKAPAIHPVYGNVSQVLVYPYMTSQRLLVMEIDKTEYNGNINSKNSSFIHYDRIKQRVLSRQEILTVDVGKENKLLKIINKHIDELNKGRGDNKLQHALNVPSEVCCCQNGIKFLFKQGTVSSSPIEVMIDFDKVKPYLTEEFRQMLEHNDGYHVYKDRLEPEPIHSAQTAPAAPVKSESKPKTEYKPKEAKPKSEYKKNNYGNGYKKHRNGYQYKKKKSRYYNGGSKRRYNSSPAQTKPKSYNGATRKSGRHGYAGQRRWKHRRR